MSDIAPVDIAVVGPDPLWVVDNMNRLHNELPGSVVRDYVTLLEALDELEPGLPAVVLCAPDTSAESADAIAARAGGRPELAFLLTTESENDEAALRADDADGIVEAVRAALDGRRQAMPVQLPADNEDDPTGIHVHQRAIAHGLGAGSGSRLITVTAGKGGVGTTTVAINLAAGLVAADHSSAILVDAHGATGDIGVLLGLAPPPHGNLDTRTLTSTTVGHLVERHEPTGVDIVMLPTTDAHLTGIGTARLLDLLVALDGRADVVVVDAPVELVRDAQLRTYAEHVLVVTSPELASIKDTQVVVGALAEDEAERLGIVLNHPTDRRLRTTGDDIAQGIGIPVVAELPFDDHLADRDHPVTVAPARSGFGHALRSLVDHLGVPRS